MTREIDPLTANSLELSDIIDRHPLTVTPDTPVVEVLLKMSGGHISQYQNNNRNLSYHLMPQPVQASSCVLITQNLQLIGVFTERDVVSLTAKGKNIIDLKISEVMTHPVHLLKEAEYRDIFYIISFLEKHKIRHLPVVDNWNNLKGVITPYSLRLGLQPANLLKMRTVGEVMNSNVIHACPNGSVLYLAQLMAEQRVSCIVICEAKNKPIGIVTERDIVQFQVLKLDLATLTANDVMSQPLFCLQPIDNLWMAHQEMQKRHVRRLVVRNSNGNLAGIITQNNLLRSLDPVEMYRLIEILQQQVGKLESEKIELLENRTIELENMVRIRTVKLQNIADKERLLNITQERIRQSFNLQDIFNSIVIEVRQILKCDRVLVYELESDYSGNIIAESVERDFISILGTKIRDTYFQETKGEKYLTGYRQKNENIYQDGLTPCHLELLEKIQVKAIVSVPIIINEKLWGLLVVHQCSHTRQWLREDMELLEQLSVQIAIAIQQAQAFQQIQLELKERKKAEAALQKLNEQLENLVEERTAELANTVELLHREIADRQQAEKSLQEVNYKLNNILESITEGFFALDRDWNFTHINSLLESILQRPVAELLGKNIWSEFPEAIGTQFEKAYRQAVEKQETVSFETFYAAVNIWLEVRVYPTVDGLSVYFRDISDRKKTEEALRESEERFRIALKNSPITVFYQDINLRYIWIYNPALGFDSSQVVGKYDTDLFLPEDAEKLIAIKQEVIKTGISTRQEVIVGYNDDIKCYDLSVDPLLNATGEIIGVSCASLDITPRKKTEQALQESQHFVQRIAEANPNILYIYDIVENRNVYANREIANVLGYTPEEIKKMGSQLFTLLVHPEDLPTIIENQGKLAKFKDREIIETEYRMRHANGEWRWLYSWDTIFTRTKTGKAKQILGTASDISALKQVEEALRQQVDREQIMAAISQRIRQSLNLENILSTTVAEVQQLLEADRVLVYQIFNNGTGKVIAEGVAPGWPKVLNTIFPAEAFPVNCYQNYMQGKVYVVADRDRDNILPCMVDFMQEFSIQAKLVVPIIQQDIVWGLLIAHQCSTSRQWQNWEIDLLQQLATQLAIAIQQSLLYQQLQSELGERQRAEEQLRQNNQILANTNAELARATRLKDEFLANMSHELRTPLNAILGMSEALLEEICGPITDRQRKSLNTIERSGKHLLELINDILDLAKIESGKIDLDITSVSIYKLTEYCLTFVKQQAYKKNITLSSQVAKNFGDIQVDERRMRQVLINLLANAVKFTMPDGHVTIAVTAESELVSFSVIDTGIGIAQEDMHKLFQAFVQLDSSLSRRYEGTGLGLALVRRIVELHGGSVKVESEVNKGSCFTVVLPKLQAKPIKIIDRPLFTNTNNKEIFSESIQTNLVDFNYSNFSPLILLAEDNQANIDTISNYLNYAGYKLILATNGREAVEMAKSENPHLILMDINLPEMDGLTATRHIRSNSATANIPIIALTALAMPGDKEKCLNAGASAYITKPVILKHLVNSIENFIGKK